MICPTNAPASTNITLTDYSVSSWSSHTDTDFSAFTYRASIPHELVTEDTSATVIFSESQVQSGNYASACMTYNGGIYIYSKVNTTITIPVIRIYTSTSFLNVDTQVIQDSTNPVTGGAVYDSLNEIDSNVIHKTGNETKNGSLNIANNDYLATLTTPNKRIRMWPFYIDNTYQGFEIDFGPDINNNGGIRVLYNQSANTVGLVLVKTTNGTYSEKAIDSF